VLLEWAIQDSNLGPLPYQGLSSVIRAIKTDHCGPQTARTCLPPLAAVSSEPMDGGPNCRGLFLLQPLTGYRGLPLGNDDILVGGTLIAGPGSILDRTT
jgi:hypothetical protein